MSQFCLNYFVTVTFLLFFQVVIEVLLNEFKILSCANYYRCVNFHIKNMYKT